MRSYLMGAIAVGVLWGAASLPAQGQQISRSFTVDMLIPGLAAGDAADSIQVLAAGKRLDVAPDLTGVSIKDEGGGTRIRGTIHVAADESKDIVIGFDADHNGTVDNKELRLAPTRPEDPNAPKEQGKLTDAAHTAVVYIESACSCAGKPYLCSIRSVYKTSLVLKATGEQLWGVEDQEAIMANTCSFTLALGKTVAIPQAVLDRSPSDLGVKLVDDAGVEQIVPFYGALTGTGPQGPRGPAGPAGPQGQQGPRGDVGAQGAAGNTGPTGPIGDAGPIGPAGPQGDRGDVGPVGPKGDLGGPGPKGDKGDPGPAGNVGPKGDKGDKGDAGAAGAAGPAGAKGDKGDKGESGAAGATGPAGPAGAKGDKGDAGTAGPMGPNGPAGATGPQGPQGVKGESGAAGTPGSQDVHITGDDPYIKFDTPTFQGQTFNDLYLTATFAKKADKIHQHDFASDITGVIPPCGPGTHTPACLDEDLLKVGTTYYVPATIFNNEPIRTQIVAGNMIGTRVGDWNVVAAYDPGNYDVISLSGTVQATDGVYKVINADGSMQVRINGGNIEEWHGDSVLSGRPLMVRIEKIKKAGPGPIARK